MRTFKKRCKKSCFSQPDWMAPFEYNNRTWLITLIWMRFFWELKMTVKAWTWYEKKKFRWTLNKYPLQSAVETTCTHGGKLCSRVPTRLRLHFIQLSTQHTCSSHLGSGTKIHITNSSRRLNSILIGWKYLPDITRSETFQFCSKTNGSAYLPRIYQTRRY